MEKWHIVGKTSMVCVDTETGRIIRATIANRIGAPVAAHVYRWSAVHKNWQEAPNTKLTTLRSGISRGTYKLDN